MPDVPQRLHQSKLLIGEGREEFVVFTAFLKHLHLNDVQVEDFSGKQGYVPIFALYNCDPILHSWYRWVLYETQILMPQAPFRVLAALYVTLVWPYQPSQDRLSVSICV